MKFLALQNSQLKVVNLKSHDFTGLGFNICGNMRDGIFIKDVLHRGPAFESGCINSGNLSEPFFFKCPEGPISGPTWIFQVDFGSLIWTFPVRTGCIDIPSLIPLDYANPSALRVVPIGMTTTLLVLLDMLQAPCGLIKILLIWCATLYFIIPYTELYNEGAQPSVCPTLQRYPFPFCRR